MILAKKDYFIGDKKFYKKVIAVVLPIIIQNTITNVVSLLDNVMVGRLGTVEMSSVAIINQLIFVFNLCVFGAISGAGIFSTQYAGAKDHEGVRNCFRMKVLICLSVLLISFMIFGFFSEQLIGLYLAENTSAEDIVSTITFGKEYLMIMMVGLIPFTISQIYSSTMRELGETKLPMYASAAAIFVNLLFNYFLIFGKCGFPKLGVTGAAIATSMSRFVELFIAVVATHRNKTRFAYIKGVYKSLRVPGKLSISIIKKGLPILFNEFLWSLGMATLLQCYSVRGLEVVAAANIASTINNLFNVVLIAMGSAIGILVGQCLGGDDVDGAKKTVWRMVVLGVVCCTCIGIVLIALSGIIPHIYNTEAEVKHLATSFLIVIAIMMPFSSLAHDSYFVLRSGGKTLITFLFDGGFMWLISVPVAFILTRFTTMNVAGIYALVISFDLLKGIVGCVLLKKGVWISNIVKN